MRDHPIIEMIQRTGYPNLVAQYESEHCGIDYFGDEVFEGDSIIFLPNGEMLLEDNLEDYLIEELGFYFTTAK